MTQINTILVKMKEKEIDIEKARLFLQEKENIKRRKKQQEVENIIEKLKTLGNYWKKYKVKKVYLHGSMVNGIFYDGSDIDIAVTGVGFQEVLNLFSDIGRHFDRVVDVRSLEDLPFKEKVQQKGVLIYED
ncbi:MAG: nucleotidyltransferase domain-containing protein [Candidatus Aminicenantes bacterium]|nr:nucleotidyltransferase domain-containing protein [Candidatus Aminicenantes bacterium]